MCAFRISPAIGRADCFWALTSLNLNHEDHEGHKEHKFIKDEIILWKLRVLRGK
jgi:hypothetical protein